MGTSSARGACTFSFGRLGRREVPTSKPVFFWRGSIDELIERDYFMSAAPAAICPIVIGGPHESEHVRCSRLPFRLPRILPGEEARYRRRRQLCVAAFPRRPSQVSPGVVLLIRGPLSWRRRKGSRDNCRFETRAESSPVSGTTKGLEVWRRGKVGLARWAPGVWRRWTSGMRSSAHRCDTPPHPAPYDQTLLLNPTTIIGA